MIEIISFKLFIIIGMIKVSTEINTNVISSSDTIITVAPLSSSSTYVSLLSQDSTTATTATAVTATITTASTTAVTTTTAATTTTTTTVTPTTVATTTLSSVLFSKTSSKSSLVNNNQSSSNIVPHSTSLEMFSSSLPKSTMKGYNATTMIPSVTTSTLINRNSSESMHSASSLSTTAVSSVVITSSFAAMSSTRIISFPSVISVGVFSSKLTSAMTSSPQLSTSILPSGNKSLPTNSSVLQFNSSIFPSTTFQVQPTSSYLFVQTSSAAPPGNMTQEVVVTTSLTFSSHRSSSVFLESQSPYSSSLLQTSNIFAAVSSDAFTTVQPSRVLSSQVLKTLMPSSSTTVLNPDHSTNLIEKQSTSVFTSTKAPLATTNLIFVTTSIEPESSAVVGPPLVTTGKGRGTWTNGKIAGVIIAALTGLALIILVVCLVKRRQNASRKRYRLYNDDVQIPGFTDLGGTVRLANDYEMLDATDASNENPLYDDGEDRIGGSNGM